MTYTQGPWVIDKEYTDTGGLVTVIRNAAYHYVVSEYGVSETDAPIIAAAPELVEALRDAANRIDDMLECDDGQAWSEARRSAARSRALLARIEGDAA